MASSQTAKKHKKNFLNFFPPPNFLAMPAIGVDISDSSVKFMELKNSPRGIIIGKFGEYKIPENVVVQGDVGDASKLAETLQLLKKEHKFNFVNVSLPEERVFIFQTQIPTIIKNNQLGNVLEFQIEEHVPLSPRDAIFDSEPLEVHEADEHVDVSVTVYPKETIAKYIDAFYAAGLTPLSFEIEAQSIARAVIGKGETGAHIIVDFGRKRTGLAITKDGVVNFTSTVDVGGDAITAAIMKGLSVDVKEAERIKNEEGFMKYKDKKELFESIMGTVSALRDEINRHYMYWHTRKDNAGEEIGSIDKIILCGGNANLSGLAEYLAVSMKLDVLHADVWQNVFSFEDFIPPIDKQHSLGFATAIGLALRGKI